MLYGLALFVAPTCGWPLSWTIVGSGAVILAYCVVGGLWAVVITDFLQAAILMPFTIVMFFAALAQGGRALRPRGRPARGDDLARAPPGLRLDLRRVLGGHDELRLQHRGHGPALLQRGGRARLAQDRAPLLLALPPGRLHLVRPPASPCASSTRTCGRSGPASPTRTSPPTRSPRSPCSRAASWGSCWRPCSAPRCRASPGVLNIHASIISRDIFPTLFPRKAGEAEKLTVAWTATFAVGVVIIGIALAMAAGAPQRLRGDGDLQHGDVARLRPARAPRPRGAAHAELVRPRLLRGRRSPWAPSAASSSAGASSTNVLVVVPASVAVFFLSRLFPETDPAHAARHDDLFRRLDTPVDMAVELARQPRPDHGGLPLPEPGDRARGPPVRAARRSPPRPGERATVVGYVAITLALAAALSFVRGKTPHRRPAWRTRDEEGRSPRARSRSSWPPRRPRREWPRSGPSATATRSRATTARSPLAKGNAVWDGQHRAPRGRPQRDRRLPGDRRSGRLGHPRPLGGAAGAAATRRERADRLRAARAGPDASTPAGRSSSSPCTT